MFALGLIIGGIIGTVAGVVVMSMMFVAKDADDVDERTANDIFDKRSIVSVKDEQYLKLTGCIAYAFNDAPKVQLTDGFLPDGMYKVGIDLPAGEYKVIPEGDLSYQEVCKDSSHTLDSIISNDILQEDEREIEKAVQEIKKAKE